MKNNNLKKCGIVTPPKVSMKIQTWSIDKLIFYARNPRKNDKAVDRMCSSLREFGFKIPCLVRSDGEVIDGHLRLKAARKLSITEIPVILCDEWTPAQVKAFRLMVNRSATWADWDEDLLKLELMDLQTLGCDLVLTGFDTKEIDDLLLNDVPDEDAVPPVPANPVSCLGDLWLCGSHRVLCGDAIDPEAVSRLLGDQKPLLMVVDPPYGIELDSEWRDRAHLNKRGPAEPSYLKHRTVVSGGWLRRQGSRRTWPRFRWAPARCPPLSRRKSVRAGVHALRFRHLQNTTISRYMRFLFGN
jgi:hypothetical protein